jgi:uncharacterized protein (TIGR02598 family)
MQPRRAFTLVEVTLTLGIVTAGLVALLGVLPLALAMLRDSKTETRAGHIAQTIFADLQMRRGIEFASGWQTNAVFPSAGSTQHAVAYTREGETVLVRDTNAFFHVVIRLEADSSFFPAGCQADLSFSWPGNSNVFTALLRHD